MSIADAIEAVVLTGWGGDLLVGTLIGFLDGSTPHDAYIYIKENRSLVSDGDEWRRCRDLVRSRPHLLDQLTTDRVMRGMSKYRPDIASVIINHPDGLSWVERQVVEVKRRLTATA